MKKNNRYQFRGFTLVELMVVISIISLLAAVLFANFNDARKQARDKARMVALKELQLSIEFYKAQYGVYPAQGCGSGSNFAGPGPGGTNLSSCTTYVTGLAPDFISTLPIDPKFENDAGKGFYYRSDGSSFKVMLLDTVETHTITAFGDEFARCPASGGGCASVSAIADTYAVYSAGAETW